MPDRKLRSNFTQGTTPWAMRRAQWTALGLTDADLEKRKIAPEGAAGGPLGLVRDGDMIGIDVGGRAIDLEVEAGELGATLSDGVSR